MFILCDKYFVCVHAFRDIGFLFTVTALIEGRINNMKTFNLAAV